jgi:hypothetical protein
MRDEVRRTPAQLEAEIATLRQRVAALEAAEQVAWEARHYAEQVVDTVHEALLGVCLRISTSGMLLSLQHAIRASRWPHPRPAHSPWKARSCS